MSNSNYNACIGEVDILTQSVLLKNDSSDDQWLIEKVKQLDFSIERVLVNLYSDSEGAVYTFQPLVTSTQKFSIQKRILPINELISAVGIKNCFFESDDSLTVIDNALKIINFNQVALNYRKMIFGKETQYGESILDYVPEKAKQEFIDGLKIAQEMGANTQIRSFTSDTGVKSFFKYTTTAIRDSFGGNLGYLLRIKNITLEESAKLNLNNTPSLIEQVYAELGVGIMVCNSRYEISYSNNFALDFLQISRETKTIKPGLNNRLVTGKVEKIIREITLLLHTQLGHYSEDFLTRENKWVRIRAEYFHSIPNSVILYISDVTEDRKKEEKIAQLNMAMSDHLLPVMLTEADGTIVFANDAMVKTSGYSELELIGQNPRILKSGNQSPEIYSELWSTITADKEWQGIMQNRRKDGSLYWEKTKITPMKNAEGTLTHFVCVKQDVTELKENENRLEELNRNNQELMAIQSDMIQNFSHELRTPLNGLLGFISILYDHDLSPESLKIVDKIYYSGNRLSKTLITILDIINLTSKANEQSGELINLYYMSEAILQEHADDIKTNSLQIILSDFHNQEIYTNRKLLQNAISAVISNAIKFNSKQGTISISVQKNTDGSFKFIVEDTGVGIKEENLENVFTLFYQESTGKSRHFEGLGLGLPLAKMCADVLGIEIKIESGNSQGTTVSLIFSAKFIKN